ncbi:MAG: GNAT family N-acetyltransferase [Actinobacteria bacterium]|nr:GNAT family N-acetyltransferase [Actinomycetota bacterium]
MLIGDKVTLRPLDKKDYPDLYRFRNDLELTILGDDEPPVPRTYEAFTAFMDDLSKKDDGVMFVIEADGKPIGSVGLFHFDRTSGTCELGISIGEHDYLGKGYGTETVRLTVEYAFRYRNFHKVYLHVTADNERAIGSYKRCGFVEEGRLRQHLWSDGTYKDVIPMGILSSELKES